MIQILIIISLLFVLFAPRIYAQDTFKVLKVVDGDTIQVNIRGTKEFVRLLGIDAPESVDPRKPVQCFGKAASERMKSFVFEKSVILVEDRTQENRDKYNRLLRYVYLPDDVRTFVNGEMVKQGYAFSFKTYPTKMLAKFDSFEQYAREHHLGLWGSCPISQPPSTTVFKSTTPKNNAPTATRTDPAQTNINGGFVESTSGFTCSGKTICGQMTSCAEARFYLTNCGISRLDGDKDGTPCETLCN